MSLFPITISQVCENRTWTILILNTSITLHHLETKLYIHWENPSPLFTGLVTTCIYIYLHLHAGYSFQRKYSSSSCLHYSITLNIKETVHIYLFLFTFFLLGIIDIVRIQCKAQHIFLEFSSICCSTILLSRIDVELSFVQSVSI